MKNLKRILIFTLILTMLNISQVFADIKYTETEIKGDWDKYQIQSLAYSKKDLFRIEKNFKFGYIDIEGNEIIPCVYDSINNHFEGIFIVNKGAMNGLMNTGERKIWNY